jgi:hypothetical protein
MAKKILDYVCVQGPEERLSVVCILGGVYDVARGDLHPN